LRRKHGKEGYLDGKTKAGEENLQLGFDEGYPVGAKLALQAGEVLGMLQMQLFLGLVPEGVSSSEAAAAQEAIRVALERAQSRLHITAVLSQQYFSERFDLLESKHPVIA
ncbi:Yae1p ASCRUDRAFT_21828, partial [Ascoidea rubescens DSM 1968]